MKNLAVLVLILASVVRSIAAVHVGDTYAQVLKEKGLPPAKMEVGATHILRYADQTIRIKDGLVIAIERTTAVRAAIPAPVLPVSAGDTTANHTPDSAQATWTTDYTAALARAKEQNRHVFLLFTGSDWCVWCGRLQNEILQTAEFGRYAEGKLILVELDFPRKRALAPEVRDQNARLAEKYGIEGYPTVVVLDQTGKKVGELGYQEGGPKPFVDRLKKL